MIVSFDNQVDYQNFKKLQPKGKNIKINIRLGKIELLGKRARRNSPKCSAERRLLFQLYERCALSCFRALRSFISDWNIAAKMGEQAEVLGRFDNCANVKGANGRSDNYCK